MPETLVSVVIPVYNGEKTIERALASVFRQSEASLEVIVINDGSTDTTKERLDALAVAEPRLHLVHTDNRGVSAARNMGLDIASGEYIAFLDSDDEWEPNFVERSLELLRANDVDAVRVGARFFDPLEIDEAKSKLAEGVVRGRRGLDRLSAEFGAGRERAYCWWYVSKTHLARIARFPEDIGCGEDLVFTYDLFANLESIAVTKESLYRCNVGSADSITRDPLNRERNMRDDARAAVRVLEKTRRSTRKDLAPHLAAARVQKTFWKALRAVGEGTLDREGYYRLTGRDNAYLRAFLDNAVGLPFLYHVLVGLSANRSLVVLAWPFLRGATYLRFKLGAGIQLVKRLRSSPGKTSK